MYTLPTVPTPILHIVHMLNTIRDRPFNLKGGGGGGGYVFCFVQKFFSGQQQELEYFFSRI